MAGADISSLIYQAAKDLQNQSYQDTKNELIIAIDKIDTWLAKAMTYTELNSITLKEEAQDYASIIYNDDSFEEIRQKMRAYKSLESASQEVIDNSIILEGYELLNTIGETIRQEPIKYSITVTGTGDWSNSIGEVITWEMDYGTFKSFINVGSERLTLKDSAVMIRELEKSYKNNESNLNKKVWTKELIHNYQNFHLKTRELRDKKYNRGVTLEGFFRWLQNNNMTKIATNKKLNWMEYSNQWEDAIVETAANNLPFYAGGDIGNIQIKGMDASVSNINTMISALTETRQILYQIITQSKQLASQTPNLDVSEINNDISQAIQQLLAQYGFKSG